MQIFHVEFGSAVREGEAEVAGLMGRGELRANQRCLEAGRVEVRRRVLVVIDCGLTVAGHDGEELRLAVRQDGEREVLDLIVQRVFAHGIHPHHAVGQIRGGPRGFEQDADVADGGVDFVHRVLRAK